MGVDCRLEVATHIKTQALFNHHELQFGSFGNSAKVTVFGQPTMLIAQTLLGGRDMVEA